MNQKNLIMAAILSVVVLVGWNFLFPAPERPRTLSPVEETAPLTGLPAAPVAFPIAPALAETPPPTVVAGIELEPISDTLERKITVESAAVAAVFSNRGAQLVSLRSRDTEGRDGQPLEMVRERDTGPYPFALLDANGASLSLNEVLFTVEQQSSSSVRFVYRGAEGSVVKEFHFEDSGLFEVDVTFEGRRDWSLLLGPGLRNPNDAEVSGRFSLRAASYESAGSIESIAADKTSSPVLVPGQSFRWIGLEDTYFLTVLAPHTPLAQAIVQPVLLVQSGGVGGARYVPHPPGDAPEGSPPAELQVLIQPGAESFSGTAFFGAKRYSELSSLPGGLGLEKTIRWSWMGFLARPMLWVLLWIHDNLIDNYGWSIVLLTLAIKILVAPLTHKSYVSSRKMQAIQPKLQAIKQKYRSKLKDKRGRPNVEMQRKQNEELQGLMRKEGVNPLGGCLPILFQMPFFFAFFTLLRSSVELWNAPWILWIGDLSAKDPIFVLPIVMGASQFLQQRIIGTTSMEPAQKMMMNLMPIMFMFFFISAPSGLVLYWVTSNILTIVQQLGFRRLRSAGFFGGDEAESSTAAAKGRS